MNLFESTPSANSTGIKRKKRPIRRRDEVIKKPHSLAPPCRPTDTAVMLIAPQRNGRSSTVYYHSFRTPQKKTVFTFFIIINYLLDFYILGGRGGSFSNLHGPLGKPGFSLFLKTDRVIINYIYFFCQSGG